MRNKYIEGIGLPNDTNNANNVNREENSKTSKFKNTCSTSPEPEDANTEKVEDKTNAKDVNVDNLGTEVSIPEKVGNKPRWPVFEQSIDKAANEGKTCFFEFKEEQEKDNEGNNLYKYEDGKILPVMDEGKQQYENFKAFIKKHESDFKKLVRKHDLMLVYWHRRVFFVPTRYLKDKNKVDWANIIQNMIKPILSNADIGSLDSNIYLFTHGSWLYNPFKGSDVGYIDTCPNKRMALVTSNNCDGLLASEYGMRQRGERQGRVVNALLNKIVDEVSKQYIIKLTLRISADSLGNVVNNFIMDQLLNEKTGVLRPLDDDSSIMNCTYRISAPHFSWPFTPSCKHIYSSLLNHNLPSNFTILTPRPSNSRCCCDILHPKCVLNNVKRILETNDNTNGHCSWP